MTRYKTSVEIVVTVFVVFLGNKIWLFKMDEKVLSWLQITWARLDDFSTFFNVVRGCIVNKKQFLIIISGSDLLPIYHWYYFV